MDWPNESYVRLYVRDTTSWMRLGWDGQCCLMALLRKADRAGAVDLDGLEPWEAVMLQTAAPEQAAKAGTAALLRVGVVEVRGGLLVFPNYIEAQECSKSDRQRQKESRARRSLGTAPSGGQSQRPVVSQNVTEGHELTRAVTDGHSLPCSALPSPALPSTALQCPAGVEGAAAPPTTKSPSSSLVAQLYDMFRAEAHKRGLRPAPTLTHNQRYSAAERVLELAAGGDLEGAAMSYLQAAFDDSASTGKPVALTLTDCQPGRPAALRAVRGGRVAPAPAAPHSAFDNQPDDAELVLARWEAEDAAKAAKQARTA